MARTWNASQLVVVVLRVLVFSMTQESGAPQSHQQG
jgi:hypothetical protein